MKHTLLLGLLVALTPFAVSGQDLRSTYSESSDTSSTPDLSLLRHLSFEPFEPAALNAVSPFGDIPAFLLDEQDGPDLGAIGDSFTEEQILRRMGRIYEYQAELLAAKARGDERIVEDMLDISMSAVSALLTQPDILDDEQFQDLYRTVVTQHERYFGFSDSLAVERGDIYQVRDHMFSALNGQEGTSFERIELPELSFADTEVDMTINDKVRNSIVFLLTDPDRHINNWLSRSDTYFPMIEQILREEGVPDELKYLAMIESGLNPDARSWASAVGMWQFIRATGRAYGLNVNGWVDERRNPEKATRAAAKHLKDLHRMFGDWQLALAGYNYSPGKLRRHLRRAEARLGRKATFWDVYNNIPRETRNYVPMFIATSLVASNPQEFGLGQGYAPGKPYEFDYVPVYGMLSLGEIASLSQTDVATIKALNPELRGNSLPPTRAAYYIRLPLYSFDTFAQNYSKLPAAAKRPASHHRVRKGETLGQIAKRYGVSVSSLMRKNGLHSSVIRIGQTLVVPITNYSGGIDIDISDASPMRIQYGMRSIRPISPNKTEQLDSQMLIARAQERAEERRAEEMKKEQAASEKPKAQPTRTASNTSSTKKEDQTRVIHRVRRGDTLIDIARKYRVTVPQIREWNNIKSNLIRIGQRLTIYQKTS